MTESSSRRNVSQEPSGSPYPIPEDPMNTSRSTTPVLVVSPHPDDMESGAGGTVARWAAQGRKVVLVVCTNGNKGTSDLDMAPEVLAATREEEQKNSAEVLGLSEVVFLRFPDQALEDCYELREKISRQIRIHRPETVVTVDPNRPYIRHPDHYTAGRVTLNCVFPFARDVHAFPEHIREGLEPHKVREVYLWGSPEPDTFLDVTDSFETKLRALSCHRSQVEQGWELRDVRARTRYTEVGRRIGVQYAEAFKRIEVF
ncbi:MAG: PIG-L family deacetylase [Chloroflexi bacterium]|nr:PIG-L family deacetylase [Chloroflexota bacterium]